MKKNVLHLLMALVLLPTLLFGQGSQDFESQTVLTSSYADGSFVENGITYEYTHCRDQDTFPIAGNGIMLRRISDNSHIKWTIPNGIGSLSFKAKKAYTGGANNRRLLVLVNGDTILKTPTFGTASLDKVIYPFSAPNINVQGSATIRIEIARLDSGGETANVGNRQVVIDDIEWTAYPSTPPPSITVNPLSLLGFAQTLPDPSASQTFSVSGTDLTADIVVSSTTTDYEISLDDVTFSTSVTIPQVSGTVDLTTIYVRLKATTAGTGIIGTVTATSTGATLQTVMLTGTAINPPKIIVNPPNLSGFAQTLPDPSASQTFSVSGTDLTADIVVSSTTTDYEVSLDDVTFSTSVTIPQVSGIVAATNVYVRLIATTVGTGITGTVTATSTGATLQTVMLTGTASNPPCSIANLNLTDVECNDAGSPTNPSDDYITFTLNPTGVSLGSNYTVMVPTGYTVTPQTAAYGSATTFKLQDGSAGGGDVVISVEDNTTNACIKTETIVDPGVCSSATPLITVSPLSLSFNQVVGSPSATQTFTVKGVSLTDNIVLTASPLIFEISTSANSGFGSTITLSQTSGTVDLTTIYVRLNALTTGANIPGTIAATSTSAITKNVIVSGTTVNPPNISVDPLTLLPFAQTLPDPSVSQTLSVSGTDLTANIVVSATTTDYQVSLDNVTFSSSVTVPQTGGTAPATDVYVRLNVSTAGTNIPGTITATSAGATPQTVIVSGTASNPPCSIANLNLANVQCNDSGSPTNPSDDYITFTLNPTGVSLGSNYTVIVPTGYTVTPPTAAYGSATTFTLQAGSAGGGNIAISIEDNTTMMCVGSTNLTDVGTCSSAPLITVSPLSLSNFNQVVGTPSATQTFTVQGASLTDDIVLTASPSIFEISTSANSDFGSTITLSPTSGTVDLTTIYVRLNATTTGSHTGTITASSTGATNGVVDVNGEASITYVVSSISDLKQVDASGKGTHLGEYVQIIGVLHCANFAPASLGYRFAIIDENGDGFYIFSTAYKNGYTDPQHGDSLKVKGKVAQFNGLLQVEVDEIEVIKTGAITISPVVVSTLNETTESQYIEMTKVRIKTPIDNFAAGDGNVTITDGTNDFTMRTLVATGFSNAPAPQGWFSIIGIGSQFDSSEPYTSGYQIIPCSPNALQACVANIGVINGNNPDTIAIGTTKTYTTTGDAGTWTSSNPAVVSIDPITGEAKGEAKGTVEISHTVSTCDTDVKKITVTVNDPNDPSQTPPAGINDSELARSISVFPNPVQHQLTITHSGTIAVYCTITDINGKVIIEQTSVEATTTIDTQKWTKGVYIVHFVNEDKMRYTSRIVK